MSRHLFVDEHVFSQSLSKSAFRWAGAMATDGCVCISSAGYKCIGFTSKDREFVEDFKRFLSSEHAVKSMSGGAVFQLDVANAQLFDDLVALGITPRKSLDLEVVPLLTKSPIFWSGSIDGDGCLHWQGNTPIVLLSTSSIAFAMQFKRFCLSLGSKTTVYDIHGTGSKNPGYQVRISGQACRPLLQSIYPFGAPALLRKRILADEMLTFLELHVASSNGRSEYFGRRPSKQEVSELKEKVIRQVALKYSSTQSLAKAESTVIQSTADEVQLVHQG